jgi:hypothetical protein
MTVERGARLIGALIVTAGLAVVVVAVMPGLTGNTRAVAIAGLILTIVLLGRQMPPRQAWSLIVDARGVRRLRGEEVFESVAWSRLVGVSILTTSDGPYAEDFFFALHAADGTGCLVPQELAVTTDLLVRLQRLPGFDNMAVVTASGSTSDAQFWCWRGTEGQGLAAGEEQATGDRQQATGE